MTTIEKENVKNILRILRKVVENLEIIVGDKEEDTPEIIQEMIIDKVKVTDEEVGNILKELGISPSIKGYLYLKEAILYVLSQDDQMNLLMTKDIYPRVAKFYKTTSQRAERAIRHAIEMSWDRGDQKTLEKYFYSCTSPKAGKPTNSEFIYTIVDYINSKKKLQ